MKPYSRRQFSQVAAASLAAGVTQAQTSGERPPAAQGVTVLEIPFGVMT